MAYTGTKYTNKVGQVVADVSSSYYDKAVSVGRYSRGQCTWYCYGRTLERGLYSLSSHMGNAGQWYDSAKHQGYKTSRYNPVSKSIAVFPGHVVFVEQYTGGNVYYTEANNPYKTTGEVSCLSCSDFENKFGGCLGYIYVAVKPNPNTGN